MLSICLYRLSTAERRSDSFRCTNVARCSTGFLQEKLGESLYVRSAQTVTRAAAQKATDRMEFHRLADWNLGSHMGRMQSTQLQSLRD